MVPGRGKRSTAGVHVKASFQSCTTKVRRSVARLPERRTRQHGEFNKVILPTRNCACDVRERRPSFLSNPVKVDDVASTQLGTARVALPRQGTWRKWSSPQRDVSRSVS